jgi:ATP-dependent RNA helicase DDX56/DBP9
VPPLQVEALRYRGEDIARSITKNVIREARAKDLKTELLNSEVTDKCVVRFNDAPTPTCHTHLSHPPPTPSLPQRLKEYFEDHAADKVLLRHDKPLHKTVQAPHLKHVPAYLKVRGFTSETF